MSRSVLMIMGGALVVAVLVAMIVQARLSASAPEQAAAASTQILVANKKLLIGEKVKKEDVRWQAWPDDALFSGVIKKSDQPDDDKLAIYDAPLRRDVEAGEPVTAQATIGDIKGGNNFLSATIGAGMRAMSIAVKPETAVSGFLSSGDYVDVILAYSPKLTAALQEYAPDMVQNFASETILSNVKVLAVDQEAKDEQHEAKTAKTVTLEVTKAGAEKLAMAQSMGELVLSLRRIGEKDTAQDKAAPPTTDLTTMTLIKRIDDDMARSKAAATTVRVYSGTEIQNVPVHSSGP